MSSLILLISGHEGIAQMAATANGNPIFKNLHNCLNHLQLRLFRVDVDLLGRYRDQRTHDDIFEVGVAIQHFQRKGSIDLVGGDRL